MSQQPHTPETIVELLREALESLSPSERDRCQRLILCEVVEATHGGRVKDFVFAASQQEEAIRAERAKNSRRSRPEDKERNDRIRADRKKGLSYGAIARKHNTTEAAVRGVLSRERMRQRSAK